MKYFIPIFLYLVPFLLDAQSAKQYLVAGDKSFAEGDYVGAAIFYKKGVETDPEEMTLAFKLAESLRLQNNYEEAEKMYAKTIQLDQNQLFPLSLFWMATMQKNQQKYDEAKESFVKFKKVKTATPFYSRKAKNEALSCDYAQKIISDSLRIVVRNLGESINSGDAEFAPSLINDNEMLLSVLKAKKYGKEGDVLDAHYVVKLYKAQQQEGEWSLHEELPKNINNPAYHSANASLSIDQKRLYFSRCDELGVCAIYMSVFENKTWQMPVLLDPAINQIACSNTQPQISMVGGKEILWFVSDRQGGKGGMDIWYSVVTDNGKAYSAPKNAGKKVNSPDHEITPFYLPKDGCLYFSSNWHQGLGGYDVFKSCGELKSLGIPENLGVPINSSANDLYLIHADTNRGFLVSNREGSYTTTSKTCCNDLYAFEILPEPIDTTKDEVKILAEQLNLHLPVLYFHNDEPNPKSTDTISSSTYLETYQKYTDMMEKYQEEYAQGIAPEQQSQAQDEIEDFFTQSVDRGVQDLEQFLKILKKELEHGVSVLITIKGYASPLAKTDYNVNLTLRRISSLVHEMEKYDRGFFIPYINHNASNGGKIIFEKIPFGEFKSDTTVSDNINDTKNSIYSKKAALERKIEILSVKLIENDTVSNQNMINPVSLSDTLIDFGNVKLGKTYTKTIRIKNNSAQTLPLADIKADCSCTQIEWSQKPMLAGEEAEIKIIYKPTNTGKATKEVLLMSSVNKVLAKINIEAMVLKP